MDSAKIKPSVALIMGSQSDWETMKFSKEVLIKLNIPFITKIISAHRTPDRMNDFAKKHIKAQSKSSLLELVVLLIYLAWLHLIQFYQL